jgi:LppX_LprAFG lipoprotein
VLPVALLASGCGASVSLDAVAKAADVSAKQTSEHVTLSASITSGPQTATLEGSGDFQNDPNLGQMTLEVAEGTRAMTMREVLQGTSLYVTSAVFGRLPGGKTWVKVDFGKSLKSLGVDLSALSAQSPAQALRRLQGLGSVTKVGPALLDGVSTTRYTAIIDPGKLPKEVQRLGISYGPVDVWIDDQGLVRRMHMSFVQGGSSGVPQAAVDMAMTMSSYGEAVHVAVPSADETFDATAFAQQLFKK